MKEIGAKAVIADALDGVAVNTAIRRIRPDAVINELTSLPRHYAPAEMKAAAERDRKVRVEGNINLLVALRDAGVRRYLLQSSGFWYAPGEGLADESIPFISSASPGVEASAGTYRELEARASTSPGVTALLDVCNDCDRSISRVTSLGEAVTHCGPAILASPAIYGTA